MKMYYHSRKVIVLMHQMISEHKNLFNQQISIHCTGYFKVKLNELFERKCIDQLNLQTQHECMIVHLLYLVTHTENNGLNPILSLPIANLYQISTTQTDWLCNMSIHTSSSQNETIQLKLLNEIIFICLQNVFK